MKEFACNFAIARFRPYRETAEFVNVGIVLNCPAVGFFDGMFERRRQKRVTDFFPELDVEVFQAGLAGLLKELGRVTTPEPGGQRQLVFGREAQAQMALFRELVRPREGLFYFGDIGTVLAADPKAKLEELFDHYIKRQFAKDREYQEIIMRRRLGDFLNKVHLARFYRQDTRVGNDTYNVILPFVHLEGAKPRKAIKPLHLDKKLPTEIYRHGDAWISVVRRLREMNELPCDFLFTVKYPKHAGARDNRQNAATEICKELEKLETVTLAFDDTDGIKEFANAGLIRN